MNHVRRVDRRDAIAYPFKEVHSRVTLRAKNVGFILFKIALFAILSNKIRALGFEVCVQQSKHIRMLELRDCINLLREPCSPFYVKQAFKHMLSLCPRRDISYDKCFALSA